MAKTIQAVILDVDGTLVDSNDAHARAWCDVLRDAGYDITVERVLRLIGMGSDKLLPQAVGIEKDSPEGKQLSERRKAVFHEKYLAHLKPTPGARALLERFRSDRLRLIVASSAEKDELRALLDIVGRTDLIDETTSSSDVAQSKPDPDIVAAALQKFGGPPAQALMLGDTPYDVEAAERAGVGTVAVRSGGWSDVHLGGAIAIYDHPADLLAHYETSPFMG